MYDIIIIGMGISGITAAIYAKRSNKKVLIIDKGMPGGLLNSIDKISNYPGLIDITGPDFAQKLLEQVESFDIPYFLEEVVNLDLDGEEKIIKTTNNEYKSKKVILAMGRKPKYLGTICIIIAKIPERLMQSICILLEQRQVKWLKVLQKMQEN